MWNRDIITMLTAEVHRSIIAGFSLLGIIPEIPGLVFIIENKDITIAYYSLANDVLRLDPKVDIDLDDKIKISVRIKFL